MIGGQGLGVGDWGLGLGEEAMIKSFRDLRVWHSGMDLAVEAYHITALFPKHEAYGLSAQMQRAAVSVPSNIAEGHAREHRKEYLHWESSFAPCAPR